MRLPAYIQYLENVVLCLLAERDDKDKDIECAPDVTDPSFVGFTLSPINVRQAIREHRERTNP